MFRTELVEVRGQRYCLQEVQLLDSDNLAVRYSCVLSSGASALRRSVTHDDGARAGRIIGADARPASKPQRLRTCKGHPASYVSLYRQMLK